MLPWHANAVAVGNRSTIGNGSIAPIKDKQRHAVDSIPPLPGLVSLRFEREPFSSSLGGRSPIGDSGHTLRGHFVFESYNLYFSKAEGHGL